MRRWLPCRFGRRCARGSRGGPYTFESRRRVTGPLSAGELRMKKRSLVCLFVLGLMTTAACGDDESTTPPGTGGGGGQGGAGGGTTTSSTTGTGGDGGGTTGGGD